MGSRENIENLISNLKSTQKITKKALDSPMHYFHFLFNIGKLHCEVTVLTILTRHKHVNIYIETYIRTKIYTNHV